MNIDFLRPCVRRAPLASPASLGAAALLACLVAPPACALGFDEALDLALTQNPALAAQRAAIEGAQAAQPAAAILPDPRVSVGVENLPISGMDRYSLTRDFMTMQRIALMQEVPNQAKREARAQVAEARVRREQATLAVARLQTRQSLVRAWIAVRASESRQRALTAMVDENQRLQETLGARIAAGTAQAADLLMARQEALALADRRDDLARESARARAGLRRLIGPRAAEPLSGDAPVARQSPDEVRQKMHRHAELAVYTPMLAMARAEAEEARAESRGDWSWEVAYSRRGPQWGDMVSFQFSFDLPWQTARRQQPLAASKLKDAERIEAERDDTARRHALELEEQLAELDALDSQAGRARSNGLPLLQQRVDLALASYQTGKAPLDPVLALRRELLELRMRLIELDAQRADLAARLDNLTVE